MPISPRSRRTSFGAEPSSRRPGGFGSATTPGRGSSNEISARGLETYESQLKWILNRFELAALDEITPGDVRAWHGDLVRSALHPNSVSKVYRMLRSILTTAVDDGLLAENPAHIRGAAHEVHPRAASTDLGASGGARRRHRAAIFRPGVAGRIDGPSLRRTHGVCSRPISTSAILRQQRAGPASPSYESGTGTVLGAPKTETRIGPCRSLRRSCTGSSTT